MLQPRIKFAGVHVHRDVLKAGIALFPPEGGLSYPHHYVARPIIPEGGYPGLKDERSIPSDAQDYRNWLAALPTVLVLNPYLTHFIRISPDTTRTQLESEIQRIFTPDVLATLDALLATRGAAERADMSRLRRLMNARERLGNGLVLPEGYDEPIIVAAADARFKGLAGGLDGGGGLMEIEPGTIDIGPGAINRASNGLAGYTGISLTNPANDSGVISVFEIWLFSNGTGVKIGTLHGSGTSYTSRDYESVGNVSSGSKQVFSGLDCDVETGDFVGYYGVGADIELDFSGGSGAAYLSGDKFDGSPHTYTVAGAWEISLYGESGGAVTEKDGSDTGNGADSTAARDLGLAEAGTGAEASELTTSGVATADDSGTGSEAAPSRQMTLAETGQAAEAAAMLAAVAAGDSGSGADYSGLPEAVTGADTGQGQDAVLVRIELAGAGADMKLPGRRGRMSIPNKEASR